MLFMNIISYTQLFLAIVTRTIAIHVPIVTIKCFIEIFVFFVPFRSVHKKNQILNTYFRLFSPQTPNICAILVAFIPSSYYIVHILL